MSDEQLPPCMMPDGGECCPQYHAVTVRIKELEEAAKAPLPEEVAGLSEGLRSHSDWLDRKFLFAPSDKCEAAAAALERQAREIRRLRTQLAAPNGAWNFTIDLCIAAVNEEPDGMPASAYADRIRKFKR